MNDEMKKILDDLKARQNAGEHMMCPRCGYDRMKKDVFTNALSRQAPIMICDACGANEAWLDFMHAPLPLEEWACFNPDRPVGDFKAVTGAEAWNEIRLTQLNYLISMYAQWVAEKEPKDFRAHRRTLLANCKGLKDVWDQPYQMVYEVQDGELILRFRDNAGKFEIAHDVVGK